MPVAGGLWAFLGLWCGAKQTNKDKQGLGAGCWCGAGAVVVRVCPSKGLAWFGAVLSAMVGCNVKVLGLVRW